jgi:hypothetical protein
MLPPQIEQRPADAPPPSPAFIKAAKDYVSKFCKASYVYVQQKVDKWRLLEALYLSEIGIKEWQEWRSAPKDSQARRDYSFLSGEGDAEATSWQSNYLYSPGYIVDNFTDTTWSSLFAGNEYLIVSNKSGGENPTAQFPASYRIQQLLLDRLERGLIHHRVYEAVQSFVLYGSVYAKVFWYSKSVPEWRWLSTIFEDRRIETEDLVVECPIVQQIPLDKMLVDPAALHNDIQRWRGIGHRQERTWNDLMNNFKRGLYNLGQTEFKQRWPEGNIGSTNVEQGIGYDADRDVEPDKELWLQVWEWHGAVPMDGDSIECCATFITDRAAESVDDGVLVRLTTRPLLDCGLRPFITAAFIPRPGPFGIGIIEREEHIIYQLSQFIGQAQDNARLTSNAMFQVQVGSPAWKTLKKNNNTVQPGMIFEVLAGDDLGLRPVELPPFPSQTINEMVQWLGNNLDRRTTVTDIRQGLSETRKTATEANILQMQAQLPIRSKTLLFAKNFLKPLFNLSLAMLAQFGSPQQTVTIKDSSGRDIPLVITKEELQNDRWEVQPTVAKQDATNIAKAQSIERVLPNLAHLQPLLAQEGSSISFTELARQYVELLGIENADRVVTVMSPEQRMAQQMMQTPPPGNQAPTPAPPNPHSPPFAPQGAIPQGPGGPPQGMPPPGGPPFFSVPHPRPPLLQNGGPLGNEPSNTNALAQFLQLQALSQQGGMFRR